MCIDFCASMLYSKAMYQIENSGELLKDKRNAVRNGVGRAKLAPTVLLLGLTSFLTDISSEMVATLGYGLSALSRPALLLVGANWNALAGVILVDRIGKGIRTAPRDAMIAASTPMDRLATAFGVHRAMDTAGAMIGPLLAAGILWLTTQAYDAVFVVSFCFALIGVAVIATFVRTPVTAEATAARSESLRNSLALLTVPNFRLLVLSGSLLALATISDNFLYLTLQEQLQLSQSLFPLFYVSVALIFMLFAIPVGRLADRLGRRSIFGAGYIMLIAAYGLVWGNTSSVMLVALALVLIGLYYAATDGVLTAMASVHLPANLRSSGLALLATGIGLARLCASTLYGWVWGMWGSQAAVGVFMVGIIVATWIGWWFLWNVETKEG